MYERSTPVSVPPTAEEFAALRRDLAAVQSRLERATARPRRRKLARFLPLGLAALLVALVPLATLAAHPFTDLNPGSVHNPNIDAIFNAGITTGCAPTEYCPNANVTREEMASFLARTAGLGTNKPVTNAARLATTNPAAGGTTYAANELVRVARAEGTASAIVSSGVSERTIATLTITVPVAGFVIVDANMQGHNTSAAGCPCELWMRLRDTGTNDTSPQWGVSYVDNTGAYDSASNHWVFPVTAGTQSFVAEGFRFSGGATSSLQAFVQMTALYVPFGATGGGTIATVDGPSMR